MSVIAFTISGMVPAKKNSKRMVWAHGRKLLIPSQRHNDWHADAEKQLTILRPQCVGSTSLIRASFYVSDNRRRDLSNMWESVGDLLVDFGILEDDCWQKTGPIELVPMGIDKENPRVLVELFTVD